jgi:hypothetical protein
VSGSTAFVVQRNNSALSLALRLLQGRQLFVDEQPATLRRRVGDGRKQLLQCSCVAICAIQHYQLHKSEHNNASRLRTPHTSISMAKNGPRG